MTSHVIPRLFFYIYRQCVLCVNVILAYPPRNLKMVFEPSFRHLMTKLMTK
jgi:hypothetical protein